MEKNLNYFMSLNYPVTVEKYTEDEETYFSLEIPDLPGCGSYGTTFEEAFQRLEESKELWLEESIKRGLYISEPVSEDDFSGKFLLRIPARLHMSLSKKAKSLNLSLNQFVKSLLEQEDISGNIYHYIDVKDHKIMDVLESQGRIISRLEQKIEDLKSVFSQSHFSKSNFNFIERWTSNDSYYQVIPTVTVVCENPENILESAYSIIDAKLCSGIYEQDHVRDVYRKIKTTSLEKKSSPTTVTSFALDQNMESLAA